MGSDAIHEVLLLLERLVKFDTQNPPRAISGHPAQGGIFPFIVGALGPSFSSSVTDLGDGCVSLLAVRGAPSLLFNVHIDTVPRDPGWRRDPFDLNVDDERAVGLGAADIKGAAACLIAAARRTTGDLALLFTSDEEAGSSRCVKQFLEGKHGFRGVIVGEPTTCRAVLEHRGIATATAEFSGTAGHASAARALVDSAVHEAMRWGARALAFAEAREARRYKSLAGVRFNLGLVSGGIKANMIASTATARFGVRPLPDERPEALLDEIEALAERPDRARFTKGFLAPPLPAPLAEGGSPAPADGASVARRVAEAASLAEALALPIGEPVDFWTEAALFSASGLPAIVYGPGNIREAHTAGEWVALSELAEAEAAYRRLLTGGDGPIAAAER
jgi:acetylornithine deacetylase